MDIIYTKSSLKYPGNNFPEGPYRLENIAEIGKEIEIQEADESIITAIHSKEFIGQIQESGQRHGHMAEVATNEQTYAFARDSVALAWNGAQESAFACTRPPGHHTTASTAKGFCFLNNMAIVTQQLLSEGKKVCILDFDGHQGDGTEQIFYESDQVLFFSIHQEYVYPYFYLGNDTSKGYDVTVDRTGEGDGEGYTYNTPAPRDSSDDVLLEWIEHFLPAIQEFAPDIIGISAGFDGYRKDALLNLRYTLAGYYHFGQAVRELDVPVFGLLEGGYHKDIPECISALVAGLDNTNFPGENSTPKQSMREELERFRFYLEKNG